MVTIVGITWFSVLIIIPVYMFLSFLLIIFLLSSAGYHLGNYMRHNHNETWNKIHYMPKLKIYGRNSFKEISFIYSKDDLNDSMLNKLKIEYRKAVVLVFTIILSIPILIIFIYFFQKS